MAFQLGRAVTKESCTRLELFYDENFQQLTPDFEGGHPLNNEGGKAESMVFYLTPLLGRAQREISDQMMHVDKKGKSKMLAGSAERIRVKHSVHEIEGLEYQNRQITTMTDQVFDNLDRWIIEALTDAIHKLNGTDDVGDDEDSAPFSTE